MKKIFFLNFIIVLLLNNIYAVDAVPTAATGPSTNSTLDGIKSKINGPMATLVMSTIGTIYSGMLYKSAAQQEKDSEANIVKLDKLIKAFKDSYVNFCPNGRELLTEPKCYCYLESGKQNPDRTNSQICKDIWSKDNYKLTAVAGDYSGPSTAVDPVGCVTLKGQFDESCTCKKFVDAKGSNSCMKTTNISIPSGLGSGFALASGLQQVTDFANNSTNGNPNLNLSDAASLNTKAINAKKMNDAILTKLGPKLPANALSLSKVNDKNIGNFAASALGAKTMQDASAGGSGSIGLASSRNTDADTSALLKNAAAKAGLEMVGSGKGLASGRKAESKDAMNFNFSGDSAASGAQVQNFPEATAKNYNYKNSDISKKSDTSIFEIISNRYIQSGLKRLFDH